MLRMAERIIRAGRFPAGLSAEEYFERMHISYGRPDEVAERLAADRVLPLATDLIVQFSPAAPPLDEAITALELLARCRGGTGARLEAQRPLTYRRASLNIYLIDRFYRFWERVDDHAHRTRCRTGQCIEYHHRPAAAAHDRRRVEGVDLAKPLSDGARDAIKAAILKYKVVFFRDQTLDRDQHARSPAVRPAVRPPERSRRREKVAALHQIAATDAKTPTRAEAALSTRLRAGTRTTRIPAGAWSRPGGRCSGR